MKIPFHHSLTDADRVLRALRSLVHGLKKTKGIEFHVESYTNCREQGYAIFGINHSVMPSQNFFATVAQHRCSDSVIVCLGMNNEFLGNICQIFCGNIAQENVYKNAKTFVPDKDRLYYVEAASFIAKQMHIFSKDATKSEFFIIGKK
jgi:hypothetical protein